MKDVLKELPGVDATDPRILSMLDRFIFCFRGRWIRPAYALYVEHFLYFFFLYLCFMFV